MKMRRVKFPFVKTDPVMDAHHKVIFWEKQKHREGFESAEEANDFDVGDDTELDFVERQFAVLTKHQLDAAFSDARDVLLDAATSPPPAGQKSSVDDLKRSSADGDDTSPVDNPAG